MGYPLRRRDTPNLEFEEMPALQNVPSAVIGKQQFELVLWQFIKSHADSIAWGKKCDSDEPLEGRRRSTPCTP